MDWRAKLIHPCRSAPDGFKSLVTPVYRASTVAFDKCEDVVFHWEAGTSGYAYGVFGTPTVLELGARIAELENAHYTFITPGGQAAITMVYLTMCKAGDHVLVPISAYGPNKDVARGMFARFGVEIEMYDPMVGSGIASLIRDNTSLIWTESPGSITMEVQDVPAIVAAAHARGVPVALDNTYSAGVLFDAFAHGVDISVQALTKYVGGHSDLLLGSVSVANAALHERIGANWALLGLNVSPDDASLALRGLKTLGVRLDHMGRSSVEVASWLAARPEVERVLHPALPSCPGHEFFARDFTGPASIFSFILREGHTRSDAVRLVDALQLFRLGYSWGGTSSLVMIYPNLENGGIDLASRLIRLNVGLESSVDLIADLDRAFGTMNQGR